jgi:hypothetical protein
MYITETLENCCIKKHRIKKQKMDIKKRDGGEKRFYTFFNVASGFPQRNPRPPKSVTRFYRKLCRTLTFMGDNDSQGSN